MIKSTGMRRFLFPKKKKAAGKKTKPKQNPPSSVIAVLRAE